MSDPVTNVEIEDVLSSIRRLVSDEERTMERARAARGGLEEAEDQKLVLTPALRVSEIDSGDDGESVAEELEAEMFVPEHDREAELDDTEVEDAEAVDIAPEGEEQADEPEDALSVADDDMAGERQDNADEDYSDEETPEEAMSEPPVENLPEFASDDASASLQDKIAQLEALIGQSKEQFEPDVEGQDEYAGDATDAIEWEDAEPTADTEDEVEDAPEGEALDAAPEEAAELHEEADEGPGWDEQHDDIDDPAPEPAHEPEIEAQQEPEVDPEPAPEVHEDPEPEAVDAAADRPADVELAEDLRTLSDDEAVLDEDTLREIVTDIVREELQGALGERITRNVRKLVRREIHRALSSQEFD